jgi:hypothetical protein
VKKAKNLPIRPPVRGATHQEANEDYACNKPS